MQKKHLQPREGLENRIAVFQSESVLPLYPTTHRMIYLPMQDAGQITVKEMLGMLHHGAVELDGLEMDDVLTVQDGKTTVSGTVKTCDVSFGIAFTQNLICASEQEVSENAVFSRNLVVKNHMELRGNCVIAGKVTVEAGAVLTIAKHSMVTMEDLDVYGTVEVYGTMTKDHSEELEQTGKEGEKESPSVLYVTGVCNLMGEEAKIAKFGLSYIRSLNVWGNATYSGWFVLDSVYVEKGKVLFFKDGWGEIQQLHMRERSVMEMTNGEMVVMTCGHDFSKGFQDQTGMGTFFTEDGVVLRSGAGNHVSYLLIGDLIGPLPRIEGNVCVLDSGGFVGNKADMENWQLELISEESAGNGPIPYQLVAKEKNEGFSYAMGKMMAFTAALRHFLDEKLPDHGDLRNFDNVWYGCGTWNCSVDWHYKREAPFKQNAKF